MLMVQDALSGGAMMPVCIDCVCNYCKHKCGNCPGDTEDGLCCKCMCNNVTEETEAM